MSGKPETDKTEARTLAERLRARILHTGPITFNEWMRAALYDEHEGYYRRDDLTRWGRAGDYRTAPERTPLFAATFARYFANLHVELGAPRELAIIEVGAGAGHFAAGLLKTLRRDHTRLFSSLRYVIDEASESARTRATALLEPFGSMVEFRNLEETQETYDACIVFSNELIDAFPVHRVTMRDGRLLELCVGLDERGDFAWVEGEPSTPRLTDYFQEENITLVEGQVAEVNLEAGKWIARIASLMRRGYVVTVDYGAEAHELYNAPHRQEGTLRGFAQHRHVENVLANPGEHDITTTVDWTQLKLAGDRARLETVLLERLDRFLLNIGLLDQLERETELAESEAERSQLRLGARELILPGGMCESFQVLVQKTKALNTGPN